MAQTKIVPDKSMAAVIRLVEMSRANGMDPRLLNIVEKGVEVPASLADAYAASLEVTPLAVDPSPICGTDAGARGATGPAGADSTVAGPTGPTGPDGMAGIDGGDFKPSPCDLALGTCGGIDPDVAAILIELFTCLEGLGLLTDSWRIAFPQLNN